MVEEFRPALKYLVAGLFVVSVVGLIGIMLECKFDIQGISCIVFVIGYALSLLIVVLGAMRERNK